MKNIGYAIIASVIAIAACPSIQAAPVQVRVTIENLSGPGGVALAPFFVAAHDGTFDMFNAGAGASSDVQNLAEFGNSAPLMATFNAMHPTGVAGTVTAATNGFGPGIFLPGGTGSIVLTIDPAMNKFFSYGAMVVPSNDFFVGNDSATGVRLFDDSGNFVGTNFTLNGSAIWDAGTEINGVMGAAFLDGQDAAVHTAQNGVITMGANFSPYANATTAAGYAFSSAPGANTPVVRISFEVVPEPASLGLMGTAAALLWFRKGRVAAR